MNPSYLIPVTANALNFSAKTNATFGDSEAVKTAWYTIQILGGQVFLPIILLTMILSKNVRRGPTLINYMAINIGFSISSCLLLYAGFASGPEPPYQLCLAQAAFIYGCFPAINLAGFFIVFRIWCSLRAVTAGKELEEERTTRLKTLSLVLPPYFLALPFAIIVIIVGMEHPERVSRGEDVFYCSLDTGGILGDASQIVSALFAILTVIMEIWTLMILYSKWMSNFKEICLPHTTLAFNVRLIKRILVLEFFVLLMYMSALLQQVNPMFITIYHFSFSLVPLGAALVFGSQPSILRVWCFWKPRKPRTEVDSYALTFEIYDGKDRRGTILSIDKKFNFHEVV